MNKLGRGVGLFVLVLEGGRNRWGCGVGFVDVGNFEGAMVKYGCVLGGLSNDSERAAYGVAKLLIEKGHTVIPVHPKAERMGLILLQRIQGDVVAKEIE